MSNTKRLLIYIIPVTTISFALNIPKFMEIKFTETNNGTTVVDASETRLNPTYMFYYTLSLIWHPTLTTGNTEFQYFPIWQEYKVEINRKKSFLLQMTSFVQKWVPRYSTESIFFLVQKYSWGVFFQD